MLSQQLYKSDLSILELTRQSAISINGLDLPKKIVTQKQIIIQIIYLLLGLPSSIFNKKNNTQQYVLSDKYQMNHLTSNALQNAVKQALQMCSEIQYVQKQSKRLYFISNNPIVKCFCQAVLDYIQQTRKYFSQILASVNGFNSSISQKLTLLNFPKILSDNSLSISQIIRCLNICAISNENRSQMINLLDKIWQIDQQLLFYVDNVKKILIKIFQKTLIIYFKTIRDWLMMKNISDNFQFFVRMQDNGKGNLSQEFLHSSNEIDRSKLPKIIQNQSKGIVQIGKTIRFIKLYYENNEKQKLMNYLDIEQNFLPLIDALYCPDTITFKRVKVQRISMNERFKRNNQIKNINKTMELENGKDNPYEMFTINRNTFNINWIQKRQKKIVEMQKEVTQPIISSYLFYIKALLTKILQRINKRCLTFFHTESDTLIKNERNRIQVSLQNSLTGIKKFMLIEQGDFIQEFFNAAQNIIDRDQCQVSYSKINCCIRQAIQNSNAKYLKQEILSCVHFDFLRQRNNKKGENLISIIFCFSFKQTGPMSYVFNTSLMQKLKQICNFIFRLKLGQSVLTKIWCNDQQVIKTDKNRQIVIVRAKILRNSLTVFLNHCLCYLVTKIQEIWIQYKSKIDKVTTVFDIVNETVEVVSRIQKISVYHKIFYSGVIGGLQLLTKFRKFHGLLIDGKNIGNLKDIQKLEFELKNIAEIVMKVPELNQMINYNAYFDKVS